MLVLLCEFTEKYEFPAVNNKYWMQTFHILYFNAFQCNRHLNLLNNLSLEHQHSFHMIVKKFSFLFGKLSTTTLFECVSNFFSLFGKDWNGTGLVKRSVWNIQLAKEKYKLWHEYQIYYWLTDWLTHKGIFILCITFRLLPTLTSTIQFSSQFSYQSNYGADFGNWIPLTKISLN